MITVEIKNIDELVTSLNSLDLKKLLGKTIRKSMFILERTGKQNTPVDTWILRNSYQITYWNLEWKLENYREYAPYVEAKQKFLEKTVQQEENHIESLFENDIEALIWNI